MQITILQVLKMGAQVSKKNGRILLKTFFLRLYCRDEGDLYANSLFDVLTIYPKCYIFRFYSRGIRIHIPILTGV